MSRAGRASRCRLHSVSGRRALLRRALASSLVGLLGACGRVDRPPVPELLLGAEALRQKLLSGALSPTAWQDAMAKLFDTVEPARLCSLLELDRLREHAPEVERGASVVEVAANANLPAELLPPMKVFFFAKGRGNPPHAHDNMVSMHLVLRGRFRVRHFDRLRDDEGSMHLRPTIDQQLLPGELTTISDERDNVHWHSAAADGALLDILVTTLDDRPTATHLLDLDRAATLADGTLHVPRLHTVDEALARYG